jgi:hypothetical protein
MAKKNNEPALKRVHEQMDQHLKDSKGEELTKAEKQGGSTRE